MYLRKICLVTVKRIEKEEFESYYDFGGIGVQFEILDWLGFYVDKKFID